MALQWLHDGVAPGMTPKVAGLARAAAVGLPVPSGVAMRLDEATQQADDDALRGLWAAGATVVRSALAFEDGDEHSGAGLGMSIPDVRDAAGFVAAVAAIAAARDRGAGVPAAPNDQVLVQRQIPARARAVIACEAERTYLEEYEASFDAFAGATSPRYAGPVAGWADPCAPAVAALVTRLRAQIGTGAFGLDVELVCDRDDAVHLVQLRPLTAPLHPGWPAFVAAVTDAGDTIPAQGTLVLDVEHNPEPLSPAHVWLVRQLAQRRPHTGGLVPLAGWLYTRTLVRELPGTAASATAPAVVLARLQREILPAARARCSALAQRSADAGADAIAGLFEAAFDAFVAMIDVYLGELIPARRGHETLAADLDDPLCLRGREDVLDVLPLAWDVAAPPLGRTAPATTTAAALPSDATTAATLLREWDDHLFALGLAPLRAVYLRVAALTGLGDDVFCLTPPECVAAVHGDARASTAAARRRAWQHAAQLRPPGRIVDGQPAGAPPRWLRGLPFGDPVRGPLAQRRDLAHLRAAPPPPGSIVALPSLTAPAAVVLHALGVRAICCEHGGAMSHAALMTRELRLSALLGCRGCTAIADGTWVELDTRGGVLRRVAAP